MALWPAFKHERTPDNEKFHPVNSSRDKRIVKRIAFASKKRGSQESRCDIDGVSEGRGR